MKNPDFFNYEAFFARLVPGAALYTVFFLVVRHIVVLFFSFPKQLRYAAVCVAFALLLGLSSFAQQAGITRIYTDFNGYWTSSSTAISTIKPDNSHNLLGFTWNGTTYSTGANDAALTTNGVIFTPLTFQAFPVRNVTLTGALPAFGQLKDGVDNGASVPPPFSMPADISAFLTDGINGLDIGTGVANVPANTLVFDFGGIITAAQIGDGIPDVLVSQIADPSSTADSVYFTDGSGNLVGNKIAINHTSSTIPSVGKWVADFYNLNGTLSAGFTKTERTIRIWAADISAFGITAMNYSPALSLRYKLNGSSDPAFLAFNSGIIEMTSANDDAVNTNINTPVDINVLANDEPASNLNPSSVIITTAPSHGNAVVNTTTGVISYTPAAGYGGPDNFSYQVCNNNITTPQCDIASVAVNVGIADLSITQNISTNVPPVNSSVVITITATNNGTSDAYGVKVDDILPTGYSFVSATPTQGSYNNTTGVWTINSIANGANAVLQITALVNPTGVYTNTSKISGTLFDPQLLNNSASTTAVPSAASSDRKITKTVDNPGATAGSNVVFTLTATNNGPSNGTGITVSDLLPAGYSYVSSVADQGSFDNTTGTWSLGAMTTGLSKTLLITATVNATGPYGNTATISGTEADPEATNNSATVTVTPSVGIPVFAMGSSSSRCQDTGKVTYSATATNSTTISYSILPLLAGNINAATGEVSWDGGFTGNATITASASGSNGPTNASHTVTVHPLPSATISYGGIPYCRSGAITVVQTGQSGGTYSSTAGLSLNASTGEIDLESSTPGTYIVNYGFSDANCSSSATATIVINDKPSVVVTDPQPACSPNTVDITLAAVTNGSTPGLTYTYFSDPQTNSILGNPSTIATTGTYYIKGTNANGCSDSKPVEVQMNNFAVQLQSSAGNILSGGSVTLTTTANTDYSVTKWTPENLFQNPTAKSQTLKLNDSSQTFTVIAVSEQGCVDSASVAVHVVTNPRDLFIPNAFTPNNDGRNDVFKVYGSTVKGAEIRIYTQWGAPLYETNDNAKGWDGTSKGVPQPIGVYIYMIKVRTQDEDTFIKKGTVNLIR